MRGAIPLLARAVAGKRQTASLFRYYWDTIEACAPPQSVMATLAAAGFTDVRRHVAQGIFSEYQGRR